MPAAARRPRLAGPFQQLVLTALVRLGRDTPVIDLRRYIEWTSGHWFAPQQLHTAIDRMLRRGWVTSWSRPPAGLTPWWLRPGPRLARIAARRFVTLTVAGRRALRLAVTPCDRLRRGLPGLGHEDRLYRSLGEPLFAPPRIVAARIRDAARRAARLAARALRQRRRAPRLVPWPPA
jgi:hypothetical protein